MSPCGAKCCFTLAEHRAASGGAEYCKHKEVIGEVLAAYKGIDAMRAAQADPLGVVHTLKQLASVKG